MKIKLFTHTDLDGVGCAILGLLAFNDIDIEYCDYIDVNDIIGRFVNDNMYDKYDKIFITDISVNEEVAKGINNLKDRCKFNLIDHHKTAEWLNKYSWCYVDEYAKGLRGTRLASGTSLFFDRIQSSIPKYKIRPVAELVEIIRKYDTWEWKESASLIPKQWNDLFIILGRDRFIETTLDKLLYYDIEFRSTDKLLLELEQEKIDRYIESMRGNIIKSVILEGKYSMGIVFADKYTSELANSLLLDNYSMDIIAIVDLNKLTISYRTIKNGINLGTEVASIYGGGGHPKAAGSQIEKDIRDEVANIIFSDTKNKD